MGQDDLDEILGISRCAICGYRLDGEIECPFCSIVTDIQRKSLLPKWLYIALCFIASPFTLYSIIKTDRLDKFEKFLAFTGFFFWLSVYLLWSL
jgi:hypothetical protein